MNRIRWSLLSLVVLGATLASAPAQIDLVASTDFDQVLQYELLRVKLKVTNHTGSPLMVGEGGNADLNFLVERKPGYEVPRLDGDLMAEPVLVKAGATQSIEVEVSRAYDLRKTGAITIIPRLRHDGQTYSARRLLIEVVPGLEVASHRYMIPGADASNRICTLRTLYRDRAQRIFLRMENETADLCYGVFDLGRLISRSAVAIETDAAGQVHVLHQSGPFRFTHSVFQKDGRPVKTEFLSKGNGQPRLVRDDDGMVAVAGVEVYEGDPYIDRPVIKPFDPFR